MEALPFPECLLDLVAGYVGALDEVYALGGPSGCLARQSRAAVAGGLEFSKVDEMFARLYLQDCVMPGNRIGRPGSEEWCYRILPRGFRLLLLELSTRDRYGQPRRRGQAEAPKNRSYKFVELELSVFGVRLFADLHLRLALSDADFARRFVTKRTLSRLCLRAASDDPSLGLMDSVVSSRGEPALRLCLTGGSPWDFRPFDKWFELYPKVFMDGSLRFLCERGHVMLRVFCARLLSRLKQQPALPLLLQDFQDLVAVLEAKFGLKACGSCFNCVFYGRANEKEL